MILLPQPLGILGKCHYAYMFFPVPQQSMGLSGTDQT